MRGRKDDRSSWSITYEVKRTLSDKCRYGQSRHQDKLDGVAQDHIYSRDTYRSYEKSCVAFASWARDEHGCRTLEEAHAYAREYVQQRNDDRSLSAYTVKLDACALGKLYGEPTSAYGETRSRYREDITRSREDVTRDRHFSEERHRDIVDFARATGLRRRELAAVRGSDYNDKTGMLHVVGKGGRERDLPIIGDHRDEVIQRLRDAGSDRVWERVPSGMDVHSYRADYATALYHEHARERDQIPREDRYCCRGEMRGVWLDRTALEVVSEALGHSRESILADHYIRV